MSATREPQTVIATWLEEGPLDLPDDTRRAIVVAVRTTTQHRNRAPWLRQRPLPTLRSNALRFGLAMSVVALAAVVGFAIWGGHLSGLVAQSPSPSPAPSTTPTRAGPAPPGATQPGGIAYVTHGTDDRHIAMVNPVNGETSVLTPSLVELARDEGCLNPPSASATGLAWSPDGHTLAFNLLSRNGQGGGMACGLHTVSSDGAQLTQVLPPPDWEGSTPYGAAWMPDGTMLAVALRDSLALVALDGSVVQDLGSPAECRLGEKCSLARPQPDLVPTLYWSPDGEWLAVSLVRLDSSELPMLLTAVVNRVGQWQIVLAERGSWPLGWMPDGRLAVSTDSGLFGFGLLAFDPDRPGEPTRLPFNVTSNMSPDWTQDVLTGEGLRIRDVHSREITKIADWSGSAEWSPDGTQLAVIRSRTQEEAFGDEIWVIGADGSNARRLVTGVSYKWSGIAHQYQLAWQPVWP